jgi:hypothetical protein
MADNLPPSCAVVTKSGNLNFLEPSGPVQACNGTALPLPSYISVSVRIFFSVSVYFGACLSIYFVGRVGVFQRVSVRIFHRVSVHIFQWVSVYFIVMCLSVRFSECVRISHTRRRIAKDSNRSVTARHCPSLTSNLLSSPTTLISLSLMRIPEATIK